MIEHRPFESLGRFDNEWLNARYHFSFAGYDDPSRRGWGRLLVWNDDTIEPHSGFAPHGHRDMQIVTYVREGAITHQDSLGNTGRILIRPSGTEPVIRVMAEGEDEALIGNIVDELCHVISQVGAVEAAE